MLNPVPYTNGESIDESPVRVAVTGAAGQIGYALLFRIASGEMLGKDQPVILQLLDLPQAQAAVKGVMMELEDCAFPLLAGMVASDDPNVAFRDADYAILVGARPRSNGHGAQGSAGSQRRHLHRAGQGAERHASRNVKVLVVGNPANTNAYIAMKSAPDLPAKNFTAMLRLDHNRALSQLAAKTGKAVADIENMAVWGNHSPTMYADYRFATIGGESVKQMINDDVEQRRVPADRRQARRRHHRSLWPGLRRLRRQRRHRPHPRLGAGHQRQVGDHGHPVRRFLRHSGRRDVRLPGDLRQWRIHHYARPGNRRIQPWPHQRHPERAGRRARAGVAHLLG